MRQCFHIVLSVEKIQKVKIKKLQGKNGRIMLLSKCTVCNNKKSKYIKLQECNGLLSSLGKKKPFRYVPSVGTVLFESH